MINEQSENREFLKMKLEVILANYFKETKLLC